GRFAGGHDMERRVGGCLRRRRARFGRGLNLSRNRRLRLLMVWFALRDGFPRCGSLLCHWGKAYLRFAVFLFDVLYGVLTNLAHLFFVQIPGIAIKRSFGRDLALSFRAFLGASGTAGGYGRWRRRRRIG